MALEQKFFHWPGSMTGLPEGWASELVIDKPIPELDSAVDWIITRPNYEHNFRWRAEWNQTLVVQFRKQSDLILFGLMQ